MIEYRPNRDWVRDLKHLGASWTLRRIVRAVLGIGVYALVVSAIIIRLDLEGHRSISGTFSLLGVILSIILAFRTNTAYDRWWEGRKQWGMLVNHSRNLAIVADASLPADDTEFRADLVRRIGGFASALSAHLRGQVIPSDLDEDCDEAPSRPSPISNAPARVARGIVARLHEARRDGSIDGFDLLALQPHTQALLDVAGACERIRKTPIPFSYNVFIKLFVILYAAILPVGLVPEYGYLAVPLVMLIVFALLGPEMMAEEIEDPFGTDCNDLPTATIAATIRADVAELLGVAGTERPVASEPYAKTF